VIVKAWALQTKTPYQSGPGLFCIPAAITTKTGIW
jgi:hypothetical protein